MSQHVLRSVRARLAAGLALLVLGAVAGLAPLAVVVGNLVVSPAIVFGTLSLGGLGLLWRDLRRGGRLLVVAAVGLLGLHVLVTTLGESGMVLPERGPAGCRVVVVESSFLFAGSGDLGTLSGPVGVVAFQSSYRADDGSRPFTGLGGRYELTWEDSAVRVRVEGTSYNPVWPRDHILSC